MMPSETDSWFTPQTPVRTPDDEGSRARPPRPRENGPAAGAEGTRRSRRAGRTAAADGTGASHGTGAAHGTAATLDADAAEETAVAREAGAAEEAAVAEGPRRSRRARRTATTLDADAAEGTAVAREAGTAEEAAVAEGPRRSRRARRTATTHDSAAAEGYDAHGPDQAHVSDQPYDPADGYAADRPYDPADPADPDPADGHPADHAYDPADEHDDAEGDTHGRAHPGDGEDGPAVQLAPYTIPAVPATGWDPASSPRRRWIGRGLLFGVLAVQAALSLRLLGAAHPDEAVAMIVGRQQLDNLLHGTPVTTDLIGQIPGSPWLYPPLAGAAANASGIFGARLVSLVLALATTALLYSLTRRLFNERVAICTAAAYAVLQSTVVVGFYAAPDALAVALVALATWIVVRTARAPVATVLLAVPTAALAAAVEYAAVIAVPVLAALALITSWPYRGRGPAAGRALLLAAGALAGLLVSGLLDDVWAWSPAAGHEARPAGSVLLSAVQWSGLFTVLACAGGIAYSLRERLNESPEDAAITASRLRRTTLSVTLCATALLIPVVYACLGTSGVMFRHLGFGMLFAAPLAGVGITRLVGAHFRNPQLGILVWVVLLALGLEQSALRYQDGPDSGRLLGVLRLHTTPQGRYLTEVDGLPEYYLGAVSKPEQWVSARKGTDYRDPAGVMHHGDEGTVAAIRNAWFTMIVLDSTAPTATDRAVSEAVKAGGRYRLIAQFSSPTGDSGTYKVFLLH
ncbi:glycosyltransferase family 39 protein [Kitasatospora sp. RG8]|uniref:ArnT family glycosyltransferase n=1 Tax=Kitasatospora sp. RG8 TaxID=2820815 RepID=UPI001ADF50C4|nr:glycosyltransferase family 39 protein [Kitasatospora sp. RG8]MBP0449554.1 glycosyltransferase family 39 protein [Kitasatospora sp. RG8]